MEPVTITAGVIALLTPYVKKAAEQFAGEAGKVIWNKTQGLFEKLQARLGGDQEAENTLAQFEKDPEQGQAGLEALLKEILTKDHILRDEIAGVLTEVKRDGPQVRIVQRVKEAERLVGIEAERVARGEVEVIQEADKVQEATGGKFGVIG
jgi:hypothetical protein